MIVRDELRSRAGVGPGALMRPGTLAAIAHELARDLRRLAALDAVDVELDDVFAWHGKAELHRDVVDAVWAPDPQRGVELRGGPLDGQVFAMARVDGPGGAFPSFRVVLPVEIPATLERLDRPDDPDATLPMALYERDGIDPSGRRFVYRYVG